MGAYSLAIPASPAGAGALSWRYIPVYTGRVRADYLLREDGALFGQGERLYCEDDWGFATSSSFIQLAEGIADVVDGYVLRRDGLLACACPEDVSCYGMDLRTNEPARLLEGVRSVVRNPPNVFAVGYDGALHGWGQNWRGSLGVRTEREGDGIIHRIMDRVSAVMKGSQVHQTYALGADGSLWHWAPTYNVYQPTPLDLELAPGSFGMGRGFPYFLDKAGALRRLANEEFTFEPFKARWTEVMNGVLDFDAPSEQLLAARDRNGALSVIRKLSFPPECDVRCTFSGVAQYLTARDVGVALREDASAVFFSVGDGIFLSIGDGIFSTFTIRSAEGRIARLDGIREPRMCCAPDGVFWAQSEGGALMEWAIEGQLLRAHPIDFEGIPRSALANGRFMVCEDSSVWERDVW